MPVDIRASLDGAPPQKTVAVDHGFAGLHQFGLACANVLELGVVLLDVLVHGSGLVELTLPLVVEAQVVEGALELVVDRHPPKFFKGHIEHALLLKGNPQHAIGFGRFALHFFLAAFGDKIANADHPHIAEHPFQQRIGHRHPHPAAHKGIGGPPHHSDRQEHKNRTGRRGPQPGQHKGDQQTQNQDRQQLQTVAPDGLLHEPAVEHRPDRIGRKLSYRHTGIHRGTDRVHDARGRGAHQDQLVLEHRRRDLVVNDIDIRKALERPPGPLEIDHQLGEQGGGDRQLVDLDRRSQPDLDIGGARVQVGGRKAQGVGGNVQAAILVQQTLAPGRAVLGVGCEVDVADPPDGLEKTGDRHHDVIGPGAQAQLHIGDLLQALADQDRVRRAAACGHHGRFDQKNRQDHPSAGGQGLFQLAVVVQPLPAVGQSLHKGLPVFAAGGHQAVHKDFFQAVELF